MMPTSGLIRTDSATATIFSPSRLSQPVLTECRKLLQPNSPRQHSPLLSCLFSSQAGWRAYTSPQLS